MNEQEWLAERFETHRARLRAVAYRMLGSASEADDAVQESWLRANRAGAADVDNLRAWLTTIVARVSLNMLQSRRTRREEPIEGREEDTRPAHAGAGDPEWEVVEADSVGLALLVVLEALSPAERLAFVLHDLFGVPFEEIATIVDRSPAATRQLASRARRRLRGRDVPARRGAARREVVEAFLAASRGGDFDELLTLLASDVVVRADGAAVSGGAVAEVRGARAVARTFSGRARGARLALVDGAWGAVWSTGGRLRVAFTFALVDGVIVAIDLLADAVTLDRLSVVFVEG
ncbi:sigma-70 family RNA polymerase sigma factor [Streptomyces profundus]|uniref:sigma-70 family RNA polymerase sigma factor n=1 Tax=Streptomyces profundus TaxID=2867410 RepID=UPI001D1640D4|nr:sigma-70 family RNA polymerase sigma factor [Streptomyces sp. MA3_2.13]UED82770.1 sigma-70 family RNA polymerase sigma factor [Streptomyces sp. MA3_2.13]